MPIHDPCQDADGATPTQESPGTNFEMAQTSACITASRHDLPGSTTQILVMIMAETIHNMANKHTTSAERQSEPVMVEAYFRTSHEAFRRMMRVIYAQQASHGVRHESF